MRVRPPPLSFAAGDLIVHRGTRCPVAVGNQVGPALSNRLGRRFAGSLCGLLPGPRRPLGFPPPGTVAIVPVPPFPSPPPLGPRAADGAADAGPGRGAGSERCGRRRPGGGRPAFSAPVWFLLFLDLLGDPHFRRWVGTPGVCGGGGSKRRSDGGAPRRHEFHHLPPLTPHRPFHTRPSTSPPRPLCVVFCPNVLPTAPMTVVGGGDRSPTQRGAEGRLGCRTRGRGGVAGSSKTGGFKV